MTQPDDVLTIAGYARSMWPWEEQWTQAAWSADKGMDVVSGLMSYASSSRGQPTNEQRSLYLAAVAFSYAVWENYIESLAVELVTALAVALPEDRIPDGARSVIEFADRERKVPTAAWELAVHPGWRQLWVSRVTAMAVGRPNTSEYGINTANVHNVNALLGAVGLPNLPMRIVAPAPRGQQRRIPSGVEERNPDDNSVNLRGTLQALISARGEAVHTASSTSPLFKDEVLWWAEFVRGLYHEVDTYARSGCITLLE